MKITERSVVYGEFDKILTKGTENKMNIKKLLYFAPPKITARVIALVLALILALASARIAHGLINNEDGTESEIPSVNGQVNVEKENEEEKKKTELICDGALTVGTVINGRGAILCDFSESTVIAQKGINEILPLGDATAFMVALTVSKAIGDSRVSLTDEAVCPASAAKLPSYSLSSQILPIGKRMQIADILRCMLYQSGASFAYTLAIHISGSEENFVTEMNAYASALGLDCRFLGCTGDSNGTVSPYDLAVIVKHFFADNLLRDMICSEDMVTVGYGQSQSVQLVVKNEFFQSYCTPSQAKNDGILGGKVGESDYSRWACVFFSRNEKVYFALVLDSKDAFSDALMLYSAYVPY